MSELQLLTPPREEEEIYPYRRVWRSIGIEGGLLIGAGIASFVVVNFLGLRLPSAWQLPLGAALAALPVLGWLLFSWYPERLVTQPRVRLLAVFVISALVANAAAYPLAAYTLQVERWLSLDSAVRRIIGYTFTLGMLHQLLMYLVLRYTVWPQHLRTRYDALAYSAAAAVGYTFVLNLHFVFSSPAPPDVVAARVLFTTTLHVVAGMFIAYALADMRFGLTSVLLSPLMLLVSALLIGLAIPLRVGLVNAPLVIGVGQSRALFGLGFSIALFVALCFVMAFLFNNAEQREREAAPGAKG